MKEINWKNNNISKLCLGTVQFGLNYGIANNSGQVLQEEVNEILKYVRDEGINSFDTAKDYGTSEIAIGKFFQSQDISNVKIISKIKSNMLSLTSKELSFKVKESLSNISIKSLFALLLHDTNALYSWDKSKRLLIEDLKEKNLIKFFGISIYTNEEFILALDNENIEIIQIPFSLFDQRAISDNWIKKAKKQNKLLFIRSIYLQGLILMNNQDIPLHLSKSIKYIKIVDEICSHLKITRNELALSFVNTLANESVILFGCDNLEQAKENILTFNNIPNLDEKMINYLQKELSDIDETIYNPTKWKKQ